HREPTVREPPGPGPRVGPRPALALEGVGASYEPGGPPVLDGFSLALPPGRKLALVGPSGAGKTTVVNLLLRYLDPASGRVTLDGQELRELRQEEVRRAIAVAGQDAYPFATSIRANVRLARPDACEEA